MNATRFAAFVAAAMVVVASPSRAMTVADLSSHKVSMAAPADFVFADQFRSGRPARPDRADSVAARAATDGYFNYDALITLGALAVVGGALAAFGTGGARRRLQEASAPVEPNWRDSIYRALQADLAQFTEGFRRAA